MAYEKLKLDFELFDEIVKDLGIKPPAGSQVTWQLEVVRQFFKDQPGAEADKWLTSYGMPFQMWQNSAIAIRRLSSATVELRQQPPKELRERLNTIVAGSITQDFEISPAKDKLYELEIAAAFQHAGFDVSLREPDVSIAGHGLSQELGVACKFLTSLASIHEHITKGYKQIGNQGLAGFVAIGLESYVMRQAHANTALPKMLHFGESDPLKVTLGMMTTFMTELKAERDTQYAVEPKLDGALLSMTLWGILNGPPIRTVGINAWALQVGEQNPIRGDLELVQRSVDQRKVFD